MSDTMREDGWLAEVFREACKRVDEWPQWKKDAQKVEEERNERLRNQS
jgi:hypothetical protein